MNFQRNILLNLHFCNENFFPPSRFSFFLSNEAKNIRTLNNSDVCNDDDGQGNDNSCYSSYIVWGDYFLIGKTNKS